MSHRRPRIRSCSFAGLEPWIRFGGKSRRTCMTDGLVLTRPNSEKCYA
jgi:hypothetical protein